MVKESEIPQDFPLFIRMYVCLSVLLMAVYVDWTLWYVRFLLEQVKSMQVSESNIWPADKKIQDPYAWCNMEVLPALVLKLCKDKDLEEGQKKCRFNLVTWQGSRRVNSSPTLSLHKASLYWLQPATGTHNYRKINREAKSALWRKRRQIAWESVCIGATE